MTKFCLVLLTVLMLQPESKWVNSVWTQKISKGHFNTLTLKQNNKALSYDCEIDYTLKCPYKIVNDTLFITEKLELST